MTEAEIDADFDAALLIGFVASVDPDSLPSLTEDALPLLAQRMRGLIAKTRVIPPAACDGSFACEAEAHAEDCYAPDAGPLSGLRDVAPEDETDEWRLRQ